MTIECPISQDQMSPLDHSAAKGRLMSVRGEPLLFSDWERALFIHFDVEPGRLQAEVPFQLDLRDGKAYVSLVAFTMRRMRPRRGGRLAEWLFKPMATHDLLNLRTYVRHHGENGIFFLAEWIPNRLSVYLGQRTFGLPYRLARLSYQHCHDTGSLTGTIESLPRTIERSGRSLRLEYAGQLLANPQDRNSFHSCAAGSLDEFLLERYTAYTQQGSKARFFRVWHPPWRQAKADVRLLDDSLLRRTSAWFETAKLVSATYAPGVQDVWMGRPHVVKCDAERHSVLSAFYEMP